MGQSKSKLAAQFEWCPLNKDTRVRLNGLVNAYFKTYTFSTAIEELVAVYFNGGSPGDLIRAYDTATQNCKEWPTDDPCADSVGDNTLDEFVHKEVYQQRYLEYFRDLLTEESDWHRILQRYSSRLFEGLWHYNMQGLRVLSAALLVDNELLGMLALAMSAWASQVPESAEIEALASEDALKRLQRLLEPTNSGQSLAFEAAGQLGGNALRGAAAAKVIAESDFFDSDKVLSRLTRELAVKAGQSSSAELEPEQWAQTLADEFARHILATRAGPEI